MKYLRSIIYDLRHQPVIGLVTILGTMLAIMLISVVTMLQESTTTAVYPEGHRGQMLYGRFLEIRNLEGKGSNSSSLDLPTAHLLYDSIPGISLVSYIVDSWQCDASDISAKGRQPIIGQVKPTDDNFWKIFDYDFVAGRPYNKGEFEARKKSAVITDRVAAELFDAPEKAVGQKILIHDKPFEVVGVVKRGSALLSDSYGEVFYPFTVDGFEEADGNCLGNITALLLPDGSASVQQIKSTVESRYAAIDPIIANVGFQSVYHHQPFTLEEMQTCPGSNTDPQADNARHRRWTIYIILLLIPAINLSSMTRSRLRQRISEIGVKRAFGCTRARLMGELILENFIFTLLGAFLGVILAVGAIYLFSDLLLSTSDTTASSADVNLSLLLNIKTLGIIFGFSFILNLLSAAIPAWKAARINPTDAISAR